ncbi:MAG TPA: SMI1/KNR4 family protein, partial [Candidatus Acidoferrum sp.]|nr:SMI1/KNR4 family protein [Candidatus Acidoferrum sp.]
MNKNKQTNTNVPQHFDKAFLRWFQEQTEDTWREYQTRTFESFVASGAGGSDWQQGTRWLGGLDEQEIASIEQRYQVHFPPDYRLFLQMLHSVDRPMAGAVFAAGDTMVPHNMPSFYNW